MKPHTERVIRLRSASGDVRFAITCPESKRLWVPTEWLQQWEVDCDSLAGILAASLSLRGRCVSLLVGRLWRLGRSRWAGGYRDVLFALGLAWEDSKRVASRATRTTRPIVIVPDRLPTLDIWPGCVPPIVALSQVAALSDNRLDVDGDTIFTAVWEADRSAEDDRAETVTMEQLKILVRQQCHAEAKAALSDDACVAAYRSEGSCRKAALLLSRELGREVSKDRVARAVKRRGGSAAVIRPRHSKQTA